VPIGPRPPVQDAPRLSAIFYWSGAKAPNWADAVSRHSGIPPRRNLREQFNQPEQIPFRKSKIQHDPIGRLVGPLTYTSSAEEPGIYHRARAETGFQIT
jgi:hypothetical protein